MDIDVILERKSRVLKEKAIAKVCVADSPTAELIARSSVHTEVVFGFLRRFECCAYP